MDIFKGQNLLGFSDRFKTDSDCKNQFLQSKMKCSVALARYPLAILLKTKRKL